VIPMLERGVIYHDDSGRYVIDAACDYNLDEEWSEYEFGPKDVMASTREKPYGDIHSRPPIDKARLIAERVKEALIFGGSKVVWRETDLLS